MTQLPGLDRSPRTRWIKRLKTLATWLVIVGVGASGWYGWVWYKAKHTVVEPRFRTAKVDRATVSAKVTATGTLSARVTVQVGSQVSGRLQDIFVDFNSKVTKGMVIAKLDPRLYQAALMRANANYVQAKGQLEKAKTSVAQADRNLDRAKKMAAEGLLGAADLEAAQVAVDGARADVTVAKGGVDQAAASLNEAQVNLGFTTIVAPIDGIVLSRNVDVGQTVAASLQAPVLFTIAQDLRVIQLDTYVAEADVGKLKPGMEATFTVDAYPGQKFKGIVRDIRNSSQTVQNVVTYDAVLDVQNEDAKLKPGMTANVTFVYAESKDALVVPNAALRFRPPAEAVDSSGRKGPRGAGSGGPPGQGGPGGPGGAKREEDPTRKRIYVVRNDQAISVRVTTGVSDGTNTEIVAGELKQGDEVGVEYVAPDGAAKAPTTTPGQTPGGASRGGRLF
jgi:HlyD family secretion protein